MEHRITVEQGTARIKDLEFAGLNSLESLVLPDSVTDIGNYAFMNCYSLREIRMPARLDYIGAGVFQNCWQLQSIVIPEGVKAIGSDMFENCHALSELTLPSSLEKTEKTALSRCRNLRIIHIAPQQIEILPTSSRYTAAITFMEEHAAAKRSDDEAIIDAYVRGRQNSLLDLAVNRRSTEAVRYMINHGLITIESLREYLKRSAESGRVEITALLLDRISGMRSEGIAGTAAGMDDDPFA